MDSDDSPESWRAPLWHPDWGDPTVELERLRSLAISLKRALPAAHPCLAIPEPGYMFLDVKIPNGRSAEVYSVPGITGEPNQRYGVFVSPDSRDGVEWYSDCVDETTTFILSRCSPQIVGHAATARAASATLRLRGQGLLMRAVQLNQAMAELLKNADARNATLPAALGDVLSDGFVEKEGCYFLAELYAKRGNATRGMFADATGYEAYVNHLHIDDFTDDADPLSLCLSYLERLERYWKNSRFSEVSICVIVSYDHEGESCTVRFHALRNGENWIGPILDNPHEAVLVARL
jgi:hypothetical protein